MEQRASKKNRERSKRIQYLGVYSRPLPWHIIVVVVVEEEEEKKEKEPREQYLGITLGCLWHYVQPLMSKSHQKTQKRT